MYIYKEPTQPPLVELDINQKPTAEQLSGWVGNRMLLPYIGQEYRNYSFDIVYRLANSPTSPATSLYSFLPLGTGIYGGMIDLTGGVVYSWFDADGNYLDEPEERTFSWKSGSSSADPSDYTEGPLPNEIQYQQGYLIFVVENWKTNGHGNYDILRFLTQSEEVEMNIITGYVGQPHITAAQDRAANQGSYGEDSYILNVGSKLTATASSATEIHIADGAVSHQGCVGVIDQGTYDVVEISPGSQGYKRIDLIVCRYERNSDTNEESLSLVAIQGTPAASNPAVPAYTQGDIQGGDLIADMPLFQVLLNGISVQSITNVANAVLTQAELTAAVNALEDDIVMEASGNLLSTSQTIATMKQVAVEVTIPTKTGYSIIAASPRTLTGASNTKVMMELDVQTGYLKLFNTHTSSVTISAAAFNIIYKKN